MYMDDINIKEIKKNYKKKNANSLDKIKYLYYIECPDLKLYFEKLESEVNIGNLTKDLKDNNIKIEKTSNFYMNLLNELENNIYQLMDISVFMAEKVNRENVKILQKSQSSIKLIKNLLQKLYKLLDMYTKNLENTKNLDVTPYAVRVRIEVMENDIKEIEDNLC